MNLVWDKTKVHGIRRIGYDMETHTMTIEFTGKSRISHSPVPYASYESIVNSKIPRETLPETYPWKNSDSCPLDCEIYR
jgi:hypothetical protein